MEFMSEQIEILVGILFTQTKKNLPKIVTSELRHATVETNGTVATFPVSNFSFINIANIYLPNVAVTTTQV